MSTPGTKTPLRGLAGAEITAAAALFPYYGRNLDVQTSAFAFLEFPDVSAAVAWAAAADILQKVRIVTVAGPGRHMDHRLSEPVIIRYDF